VQLCIAAALHLGSITIRMTITFENDKDVIVYALEKVICYARRTQQIFLAQCVWWLASIIGLEQGLVTHIDNPQEREGFSKSTKVHPDRVAQISNTRAVSMVPRDLTEDQRLDRILESAERKIQDSFQDRGACQYNRVNPLPTTRTQLKKARKAKGLQEENQKREDKRNQRLVQIRATVIRNLSKE
jgi:hypothetical protein